MVKTWSFLCSWIQSLVEELRSPHTIHPKNKNGGFGGFFVVVAMWNSLVSSGLDSFGAFTAEAWVRSQVGEQIPQAKRCSQNK